MLNYSGEHGEIKEKLKGLLSCLHQSSFEFSSDLFWKNKRAGNCVYFEDLYHSRYRGSNAFIHPHLFTFLFFPLELASPVVSLQSLAM